ncbi:623_t:CDS:2 [Diversispora eburnea]|uniref:623_t:CDS:1 n=1 Tax=Diversispora eburnea TaxID=1213867 RepID=A0A9N8ZDQ8_9GLOM|nr:623_t:CDS:2 [Diversispora eburnea]
MPHKKKPLFPKSKKNKKDIEPYPSIKKIPFIKKDIEFDCPHRVNTGSPERDRATKLIYNAMIKAIPNPNNVQKIDVLIIASSIEHNIFRNSTCLVNNYYKDQIRSRVFNLADSNNPEFVNGVVNGKISPENAAVMTAEEMASSEKKRKNAIELKKFEQRIIRRKPDLIPIKLDGDGSLGTAMFGCGPTVWIEREQVNKFSDADEDYE